MIQVLKLASVWTFWYFAEQCVWLDMTAGKLRWASFGHQAGWFFIHPWNGSSLTLCRFCLELLLTRHLDYPVPQLYSVRKSFLLCWDHDLSYMCSFSDTLLVQIPRELPEINEFSSLPSSHWCEDREATNWGLSSWLISLGRRQWCSPKWCMAAPSLGWNRFWS